MSFEVSDIILTGIIGIFLKFFIFLLVYKVVRIVLFKYFFR